MAPGHAGDAGHVYVLVEGLFEEALEGWVGPGVGPDPAAVQPENIHGP